MNRTFPPAAEATAPQMSPPWNLFIALLQSMFPSLSRGRTSSLLPPLPSHRGVVVDGTLKTPAVDRALTTNHEAFLDDDDRN